MPKITNPNHAFGSTADEADQSQEVVYLKNTGAAAISKGDGVATKYTASGFLVECEAWDTDAAGQTASSGIGVALESIAVNATGRICTRGYARGNVASGTAAKGNLALGSTTPGVLTPTAADATTVLGTSIGVFMGAKDANNLAPLWLRG